MRDEIPWARGSQRTWVGIGGQRVIPLSQPESSAPDLAAGSRCQEMRARLAASPLVAAVAVGQEVARSGVRVELVAVEIRDAGLRVWARFTAYDSQSIPGVPLADVHDAAGTTYETCAQLRGRHGLGGDFELLIEPRPPVTVSELSVSVRRFHLPQLVAGPAREVRSEAVEGPWEFVVMVAR